MKTANTTSSFLVEKYPTAGQVRHVMRLVKITDLSFYEENNQLLLTHSIELMEKQLRFDNSLEYDGRKQELITNVKGSLGWDDEDELEN